MNHPKKAEDLSRVFYWTGKQRISYQGTQETAVNSGTLWNPENFLAIVQ